MNKHLSLIIVASALLVMIAAVHVPAQKELSADDVMLKTAKKLASAKLLGYTYTRELNYPSEDYLSKATAKSYLDLSGFDGATGFKYQFVDDDYIAVYNGSEFFMAIKKKKTIILQNNPPPRYFEGFAYFYNSPVTLRNVLPKIIADPKIPRKVTSETVGGRLQYFLEFSLHKASISPIGGIAEIRNDKTSIYRVTIDAQTFLPSEVLVTNNVNKDFTRTTFADFTEKPANPAESSWYFSSYTSEYKLDQRVEKKLLDVGSVPPNFVLSAFKTNSKVSLESSKGKVVLLEFWIAHCGFCIAAVPKLNGIWKTFKDSGLEMLSINLHDSPETLASFTKRHNPVYPILSEGESTGDAYGVGAYPAIVLVGKDGKIAYAALGLFEKELESAIKTSLEK